MTDTSAIKLALKARYDIQKANATLLQLLPLIEQEHRAVAFLPSDIKELKLAINNIQRFVRYAEVVSARGKEQTLAQLVI